MAEATLLTGKRGEGKTLIATMIAKRYISQGRTVATNVNFNLDKIAPPWNKTIITRLPDYPSSADLNALTAPNLTYDESKNGLLLLDETSGFLNSHDWRDQDTKEVRFWLAQSRKDGWDLLFLAQDAKQIDAQIRNSLFELHGIAKNMSKVGIPVVSFLFQWFFNVKIRMPSMHVFTERYGFGNNAALANTEMFGGSSLYECYDTKQKINPMAAELGNPQLFGSASATMLSSWHLKGRYMGAFRMYAKIASMMLLIGCLIGATGMAIYNHFKTPAKPVVISTSQPSAVVPEVEQLKIIGSYMVGSIRHVIFSNGSEGVAIGESENTEGKSYQVGAKWYKVAQ